MKSLHALIRQFVAANLSEAQGGKLDLDGLARPGQQGSLADRIRARNAAKVPQNDHLMSRSGAALSHLTSCSYFHLDKHCKQPLQGAQQQAHGSVKRQSDIQREKKKSRQEEREEEKLRKASYYRKVTGGIG